MAGKQKTRPATPLLNQHNNDLFVSARKVRAACDRCSTGKADENVAHAEIHELASELADYILDAQRVDLVELRGKTAKKIGNQLRRLRELSTQIDSLAAGVLDAADDIEQAFSNDGVEIYE